LNMNTPADWQEVQQLAEELGSPHL
jgi:hypothetical protein